MVASNGGEDDDVLLSSFEPVDGLHFDGSCFESAELAYGCGEAVSVGWVVAEESAEEDDLGGVGCDDSYVFAFQVLSMNARELV